MHTVRVEGNAAVYQTQKSLEKLSRLEVDTVCPGHGPWFTDFEAAVGRSDKKIGAYLADRRLVGTDVLKKITVYTVLMKQAVPVEGFFDQLVATTWFTETVDLYFESRYRAMYEQIIGDFVARGILRIEGDSYITTVCP